MRIRIVAAVSAIVATAGCGDDASLTDGGGIDAPVADAIPVDATAPVVGSGLVFSAVTSTSLTVRWGAATDDVTGAASLRYKVVRASAVTAIDTLAEVEAITGGAGLVLDFAAGVLTVDAVGLTPATTYAFAIVVVDAAGNEALYEPATIDTLDASAPTPGAPITFSSIATTSLTVRWGAATDDVSPAAALRYKVVRSASASDIDSLAEVAAITGGGLVMDFTADTTTAPAVGLASSATYAFAVVVRDAAGNEALYSPATVSTLDVTSPTPGTAISFSNLAATSVTVSWGAATDDVTTPASLQYKLVRAATIAEVDTLAEVAAITGGADLIMDFATGATTSPASGLTSSTAYAFAVVVRDVAGNQALYTPVALVTLDVTDPTVVITSPSPTGTFTTAGSTVSLGGAASDNLGVASVTWVNMANGTSGVAAGTSSWSASSVPLAAGSNTIIVTATDGAGNAGTDMIAVTRDNTGPTVTITSPVTIPWIWVGTSTIALSGTASDTAGIASVSWVNAANTTSGVATGTTAWSVASVALVPGANIITVTATDGVGNSATDEIEVIRDVTGPTVTIMSPSSSGVFTTAASTVAVSGVAGDPTGVTSVTWSNTSNATSGGATGTTSWSVASVPLAAGANTIVVTATDGVGNTATDTITVTRDNVGPTVSITSPSSSSTFTTAAATMTLAGVASDPAGVVSVDWSNTTNNTAGGTSGTTAWTAVPQITLADGANIIIVTATDGVGNAGTATITVTRDNAAPSLMITAPSANLTFATAASSVDLAGVASDPAGIASVTWENSATAISGTATGTTAWSVASVALVSGSNIITVRATDAVGNSAIDTIVVTRDNTNPTVAITSPSSAASITVAASVIAIGGTASDPTGITSVTWSNATNATGGVATGTTAWSVASMTLAPGANAIIVTATDGAGNSATDTITITRATPVALAAGNRHTCALLDNGSVKCWGDGSYGQLGLGNTFDRGTSGNMGGSLPTVSLGTGRTAVALDADDHTCVVLDNGDIKCWGRNTEGQLGLGDTASRGDQAGEMGDALPAVSLGTGRTAIDVGVGNRHTCALLDNGSVKCWGRNAQGQLGLGDTSARGDQVGEMGDALPAVLLSAGRTAVALAVGWDHTCALLDNGSVKCWGIGGLLGLGDAATRGDQAGEMGDSLPTVLLGAGRTATALKAGVYHTCALLDDSSVKCWGLGLYGGLGLGDTELCGDDPGEMGDALPAVSLGTGRVAVVLDAGAHHTCALLDDSSLKCWGSNPAGELGLGDMANRGDQTGEMGDSLPAIALGTGRTAVDVLGGSGLTCTLLDNFTVKCWGFNGEGQLGLGDAANRGDQAGEMGDNLPVVDL